MRPPRVSDFPLHKPFEKQKPSTPLSEVALRLAVNFYAKEPLVLGTATVVGGNLLVTAKHVLSGIISETLGPDAATGTIDKHLAAIQILPGPEYIIWDVVNATVDPVCDIALLHLGANPGRSDPDKGQQWRTLRVNPFAPAVGERVAAFGYRGSAVRVSKREDGGNHIDFDDEAMRSVGVVSEIFTWRRDSMLPFPCYQVSARFDGGMSGGPVFDETGCLCGIVCSNFKDSHLHGDPVSYVTTLWPLFRLKIFQDRGNGYPRGVSYPAIELARGGQISVPDLPTLESWFAEHVKQVS